jgi:hypothetical protein
MPAAPGSIPKETLAPFSPMPNEKDDEWLRRIGPNSYALIAEKISPEGPPIPTELWAYLYVEMYGQEAFTEELQALLTNPIMDPTKYTGAVPEFVSPAPVTTEEAPYQVAPTKVGADIREEALSAAAVARMHAAELVAAPPPVTIPGEPPPVEPPPLREPVWKPKFEIKPWMWAVGGVALLFLLMRKK